MDNTILDFTTVSKMSEFSIKLSHMKKQLWKLNRKCYKQLMEQFTVADNLRETTRYYVMSSNEVSVNRGLEIIKELKTTTEAYIKALNAFSNDKTIHFIDELNELLDEIEGLRVLIRLSDHEKSFFA